jgi:NADH:ubiquinone oxidoreductase subunit 6 (subunit J)
MNAVVFYLLALLVVAASLAVVVAPSDTYSGIAIVATAVVVGILCAVAQAYAVAIAMLIVPAGTFAAVWGGVRLNQPVGRLMDRMRGWVPSRWLVSAVSASCLGLLIVVVFTVFGGAWHRGTSAPSLVTVLHYRSVYAFMLVVVLAVACAAAALMIGRTSADERDVDRAEEIRRQREERERRRREDREAARRQRGPGARSLEEDA